MTQIVPLTAALGAAQTGLTIGYRVLNLDRTVYSAFTATGVAETAILGTYAVTNGIIAPEAGAYVIVGTAAVDWWETTVAPVSNFWTAATRTLTSTAAATTAAVTGSALSISLTASYAATITGLTIPATWTKLWWTVKNSVDDADAVALLQLVVSNAPAAGTDGVLYVNATAASTAQRTLGSLTASQAAGTVAIALDETLTAVLTAGAGLVWDLKCRESGGAVTILTTGAATIARTVTWATS